jgi:hypothetical protein
VGFGPESADAAAGNIEKNTSSVMKKQAILLSIRFPSILHISSAKADLPISLS